MKFDPHSAKDHLCVYNYDPLMRFLLPSLFTGCLSGSVQASCMLMTCSAGRLCSSGSPCCVQRAAAAPACANLHHPGIQTHTHPFSLITNDIHGIGERSPRWCLLCIWKPLMKMSLSVWCDGCVSQRIWLLHARMERNARRACLCILLVK